MHVGRSGFCFAIAALVLAAATPGCFPRAQRVTEEDLVPSLRKAFDYASHGKRLNKADRATLRGSLTGEEGELFDALDAHLSTPCKHGDARCARRKFSSLAALYRRWSAIAPGNFEVQLTVTNSLFTLALGAAHLGLASDGLISDARERGRALLAANPKSAMAHAQYAFVHTNDEQDRATVRKHIARCLALDPELDWCRKLARRY